MEGGWVLVLFVRENCDWIGWFFKVCGDGICLVGYGSLLVCYVWKSDGCKMGG